MNTVKKITGGALMALAMTGVAAPTASATPDTSTAISATCHVLDHKSNTNVVTGVALELLRQGYTTDEIGHILVAAQSTCRTHATTLQQWIDDHS